MEQITFNPNDWGSMIQLMKEHGKSQTSFLGTNTDGETTEVGIFEDRIAVRTYQNNGWTRLNIYHEDGTCEEIFEGKWNRN